MAQSMVATAAAPVSRGRGWLCLLPLGILWFVLIDHLHVEWQVNPQYNYGWAVPFLCLFLLWRARHHFETRNPKPETGLENGTRSTQRGFAALAILLPLLYLPTRLIQQANPEWRLVSWALACITVGLTLVLLRRVLGAGFRRYVFPVCFFLVAVPWPTVFEGPLIQRLAGFNAASAAEVLSMLGIPALRHGNVIEISTGLVGVEDACSGIRSFQACLMIGLFLGAYYRLRMKRRVALVFLGFLFAICFNLLRTVLLVVIASQKGIPAIAQWHDRTGIAILLGCFLVVWWLAAMLARKHANEQPATRNPNPGTMGSAALAVPMALLLWFGACEAAVEFWYARNESSGGNHPVWTARYPTSDAGFREIAFDERVIQLLRFDEGRNASWSQPDGTRCQAIYLRWEPARVAAHLARSHTPEVCLTAAGHKLTSLSAPCVISMDELTLSFDVYHAEQEGLWVFYCLWEDGQGSAENTTRLLTYGNRLRPVLEGRRNRGQRSLEIALWLDADAPAALSQATALVRSIVTIQKSGEGR